MLIIYLTSPKISVILQSVNIVIWGSMDSRTPRQIITPELRRKYLLGLTLLPLDLCLKKKLINKIHYHTATFFASLYLLRYGPNVRLKTSYDAVKIALCLGKKTTKYTDDELIYYGELYDKAVRLLKKLKVYDLFCDIVIFHKRPSFLKRTYNQLDPSQVYAEYILFKDAIKELTKFFFKNTYVS